MGSTDPASAMEAQETRTYFLRHTSSERRGVAMIEGPLTELDVLSRLKSADVSRIQFSNRGYDGWRKLDTHPLFAEVLSARGLLEPRAPFESDAPGLDAWDAPQTGAAEGLDSELPTAADAAPGPFGDDTDSDPFSGVDLSGLPELTDADVVADSLEPPGSAIAGAENLEGLPELTEADALPDSDYPDATQPGTDAAPAFEPFRLPRIFSRRSHRPGPLRSRTSKAKTPSDQTAPATKTAKKRGALVRVLALAALVTLLGSGAGSYFLFFRTVDPVLTTAVPSNTDVYFEVLRLEGTVSAKQGAELLNGTSDDDKRLGADAVSAVARSFGLRPDDARTLVSDAGALGYAGRRSKAEGALLLGFPQVAAAPKLFAAVGLGPAGGFGNTGEEYRRVPGPGTTEEPERARLSNEVVVWFPKRGLLAAGDRGLIADIDSVASLGAANLTDNPAFARSRASFSKDDRVITFVDASTLAQAVTRDLRGLLQAYFRPEARLTASLRLANGNVLADVRGEIDGRALPKKVPAAAKLDAFQRLPREAVAYVAFGINDLVTPEIAEARLIDSVAVHRPGAAEDLERGLTLAAQALGVAPRLLAAESGKQALVAVFAPDDFGFATFSPDEPLADLVFAILIDPGSAQAKQELEAKLEATLGSGFRGSGTVQRVADGYTLIPKVRSVELTARFVGEHLLITVGNSQLATRLFAHFATDQLGLSGDKAHQLATAELPERAHLQGFTDSARLERGGQRPEGSDVAAAGSARGAMGDQRLTSAFSALVRVERGAAFLALRAWNAPPTIPLVRLMSASESQRFADWTEMPELEPEAVALASGQTETDPLKAGSMVAERPYTEGDHVQVLWNGKWYAARITMFDGSRYRVAYDGYGAKWDEMVGPERIRELQ